MSAVPGAFFVPPAVHDPNYDLYAGLNGTGRLMLGADGSFTALLQDMHGDLIRPSLQSQTEEVADEAGQRLLDVGRQARLWRRVVRLRTVGDGRDVTYAESLIVPDRLPASVRRGLEDGDKPIGYLIRAAGMETLRLLQSWGDGSRHPEARRWLAGGDILYRTYSIVHSGLPIMAVSEYFPSNGLVKPAVQTHRKEALA